MNSSHIHINPWLLPLSWIYGAVTGTRNLLYDMGWLKSRTYDIPVICVGNITVGGTGKTPHVEYLLRLLGGQLRTAVLSRGYKRKGRGYLLAGEDTPVKLLGDEPWQMKHKFPQAYVAVDADRCHGIGHLLHDPETSDVQAILLDDAFQHRRVKAGLNILLTDYNRLVTEDCLLPAGRLRETAINMDRAQVIIVTKCPADLSPMGFRVVQQSLGLKPYQDLFFSTLRYAPLQALNRDEQRGLDTLRLENIHVLLVTGIATPYQMEQDLRKYAQHIKTLNFPDHHKYRSADIRLINRTFADMPRPKLVITTEKDAARLRSVKGLDAPVEENLYVLPVQIEIMRNQTTAFNEKILNYVHKNPRNSNLAEGENAK